MSMVNTHNDRAAQLKSAQPGKATNEGIAYVENFYTAVAAEIGFAGMDFESFGRPTQVSLTLPYFAAKLFCINDLQICADAQLLSAVVDTLCRSVDNVADRDKSPERLAAGVQFSTLLLIRAIDAVQTRHKIYLLQYLYSKGGMASAAERTLYTIRSREDWDARGYPRLLGEKNASLLVVPLMLNNLSAEPWPQNLLEDFFLEIFTIVQDVDDVLDLEDDLKINRYSWFQAHVEKTLGPQALGEPDKLINIACDRLLFSMNTLQKVIAEAPTSSSLRIELLSQTEAAISAIVDLRRLESYSNFKLHAVATLPPIVAYF